MLEGLTLLLPFPRISQRETLLWGGFCSYLPIENELRLAEAWLLVRWGKGHLQVKVRRAPLLGGPSFLYCVCNWECS